MVDRLILVPPITDALLVIFSHYHNVSAVCVLIKWRRLMMHLCLLAKIDCNIIDRAVEQDAHGIGYTGSRTLVGTKQDEGVSDTSLVLTHIVYCDVSVSLTVY